MGSFGRVQLVKCIRDDKIYAMKVLLKDQVTLKNQIINSINEQKILKQVLDKPFISQLKYSFQTEQKLFLVTEY